jgi:hypothetical protein
VSAYANDPRAQRDGGRFFVCQSSVLHFSSSSIRVERETDGYWGVYVEDIRMGVAFYADPDEAIRSLIGDPL